jgi:hypothetical protein
LRWANGQATDPVNLTVDLESKGLRISSFGQDARGEIYLIHYFGGIFRIDAE